MRLTGIYQSTTEPTDAIFDTEFAELNPEDHERYACRGSLPLTVERTRESGRMRITAIGDQWFTETGNRVGRHGGAVQDGTALNATKELQARTWWKQPGEVAEALKQTPCITTPRSAARDLEELERLKRALEQLSTDEFIGVRAAVKSVNPIHGSGATGEFGDDEERTIANLATEFVTARHSDFVRWAQRYRASKVTTVQAALEELRTNPAKLS